VSFILNPYRYGSGVAPSDAPGALVYLSADSTTSPIPFDGEVYDTGNWHSGTNPSRLTMPSTVTVARVIANQQQSSGTPQSAAHQLNGSPFRGRGQARTLFSGNERVNLCSALIPVATSDYFETATGVTTSVGAINTWFAAEKVASTLKRALVYRSSTLVLSSGVNTTLGFDSEVYDTDAFHDTVTNNSRLTVPSGVSLVRILLNVETGNAGGQAVINCTKNGAAFAGGFARDIEVGATSNYLNGVSAPIEVAAGDFFEAQIQTSGAATVQADESTWFAIEEVPSTYKRCLAVRTGTQAISANTPTAITWTGTDIYDADGMHDPASNSDRITVPSGVTEARASFNIQGPSSAASVSGWVTLNGNQYYGAPDAGTDTTASDSIGGIGAWVPVSSGDIFRCVINATVGLTLGANNQLWFCVECR
jgi:hypothetical protein